MYSQFPSDGEASHRASEMRFCKGVALGFGAGLLLATIAVVALLPPTLPDTGAADPSSLIAWPSSIAVQGRTAPLRGVVAYGGRGIRDGAMMPKFGVGPSSEADIARGAFSGFAQPQQQPTRPMSAQPAPGEFSEEQLAFMRRTGKLSSVQPQIQQPTSAQSSQEGFSEDQLAFMRRRMEDQYSAPHATSWDSPAIESVQEGVRDGYKTLHRQMFK